MVTNGLPAIHPGEFLREVLDELDISQAQFARAIGVSPMRVSHVVNGSRPVTAQLALLLGRALSQSPQYWLNLQAAFDLKSAAQAMGGQLERVLVPAEAQGDASAVLASAVGDLARGGFRGRAPGGSVVDYLAFRR